MLILQFLPDEVDEEVRIKYARSMSNWTYLSTFLCASDPPAETLGMLLRIELDGKNRTDIVDRLVTRLASRVREQLKKEAMAIHERGPNRTIPSGES